MISNLLNAIEQQQQQEWVDLGFSSEIQKSWESAGVFDATSAFELKEAGHAPTTVDVVSGEEWGSGCYVATIGYKYSNGDMGLEEIEEFLDNE